MDTTGNLYDVYSFIAIGTFAASCLFFFLIYFISLYKSKQELFRQKKDMEMHFQQELLKSRLETQEEAFKRISQEIHDNITQVLSLVKLSLGTVDFAVPEMAAQKVMDSKSLVANTIRDLRQLSHTLHPDYMMDKGLLGAVEYAVEMLKKTNTWRVELLCEGEELKGDIKKELILFRIIQESVNNIVRHARASTIRIKLAYQVNRLMLWIEDDGQGFDMHAMTQRSRGRAGLGIGNMSNRASLIGADFNITSAPGEGTVVFISLPY